MYQNFSWGMSWLGSVWGLMLGVAVRGDESRLVPVSGRVWSRFRAWLSRALWVSDPGGSGDLGWPLLCFLPLFGPALSFPVALVVRYLFSGYWV